MSLKKYKSHDPQSVEVTVNSKEENFSDFCLDFVQEFGLRGWAELLLPPTRVRFDVSTQSISGEVPPPPVLYLITLWCNYWDLLVCANISHVD